MQLLHVTMHVVADVKSTLYQLEVECQQPYINVMHSDKHLQRRLELLNLYLSF